MPENSPTVRQRRLGAELRKAREEARLTLEQASAALGIVRTTLGRYETAETRPTPARVAEMLGLYGGDEALKLALMQLAREGRTRGWWVAFPDVLSPSLAELEHYAKRIRSLQVQIVPGLLQTPDYARTLIRGYTQDATEVRKRLQAREHRKAVLAGEDALVLDVILDEAVLRRPIGGPEVMRGQLAALLEAAERPNISIRVVPLEAGDYPSIGNGSVTIFEFPRSIDPNVAFTESFAGGIFIEDLGEVRRCSFELDRTSEHALSEDESAARIRAINKE